MSKLSTSLINLSTNELCDLVLRNWNSYSFHRYRKLIFDLSSSSLNRLLLAGESRQMLSNYIEQVVSEDGGRKYKCVLCTQIFHKKEHIENHVENIHFPGTFQYNCKYCGQSFDRRNMLYKHHMSCEYKEK